MNFTTMELMNRNYLSKRCDKNNLHISNLAEVEKHIINAYLKNSHTKEEVETFESHLYGNSSVFLDKAYMYQNLETVYPYWTNAKENVQTYNYEEVHQKAA